MSSYFRHDRGGYYRPRRYIGPGAILGGLGLLIVLLIAGCMTLYITAYRASAKIVTITVEDKESVNTKDDHEYRVYTDNGVYVVADTLSFWNWRAADRYAELKEGKTYTCKSAGWRIGFFSAFPNLIDCELSR